MSSIDRQRVLSVGKAFVLLNCLKQANSPLALKDITARTGYPKSTVHSLLSTMRDYRAIEQDEDGRYRLGTYFFELGNAVAKQWDIIQISQPYLHKISAAVNESVSIGKLDSDSVLILNSVAAATPMRVLVDTGSRTPIHASAMGKAMIAFMDYEEAQRLLQTRGLNAYTPHTITGFEALREEMQKIRANGYAIENGEMRIGLRAVAAPIFDIYGTVRYSIGVTGMFRKITDETFIQAQTLVTEAAAQITKRLQ